MKYPFPSSVFLNPLCIHSPAGDRHSSKAPVEFGYLQRSINIHLIIRGYIQSYFYENQYIKIEEKTKIIIGPKVGSPQVAIDGFIKSNNLSKLDIYKKKLEKGEFYFAETKTKTIEIFKVLFSAFYWS